MAGKIKLKKCSKLPVVWLLISVFVVTYPAIIYAEEAVQQENTQQENTQQENTQQENIQQEEQNNNASLSLQSKAAILMEASTGTVLYEQNADEQLSPASITKIMTAILIFDALESGKITLEDTVTTSAHAKSMGGSQVFLEEGETQTVDTLIKCIMVASGNDASVCMAEYIAGSESAFVDMMNERAKSLGMENTHFEDCCGLTESKTHYSSARDVAIMSRELITKYPQITKYTTIWMENITHTTNKGSSEFGLANTNKLLKQYPYTTGLKTGSTSIAKYCVSATAQKDGIDLIAVIMGAPDYKIRFSEAKQLLEYGYANCKIYRDENRDILKPIKISGGTKQKLQPVYEKEFTYLDASGNGIGEITKKTVMEKALKAPVKKGTAIGSADYYMGETKIGSVPILAAESIEKAGYINYLKKVFDNLWI